MPIAPLAYKYVVTAVMLMEINYCASRLPLPLDHPVCRADLRRTFIPHPRIMGVSGTFYTDKCIFSFAKSSRLKYIVNRTNPRYYMEGGSPEMNAYLLGLTHVRSLIDTNGAHRLATNWLTALEVDVPRLEKEHHWKAEQMKLMGTQPIPMFEVTWDNGGRLLSNGDPALPTISVLIAGDTRQIIHIRQEDDSYSKRPKALIKDIYQLLAIPDSEFLKYTEEQRSNLVARLAAVKYPPLTNFPGAAQRRTTSGKAPEKQ